MKGSCVGPRRGVSPSTMRQLQNRGEKLTFSHENDSGINVLQVAMYDTEEVYHFFNVVASHT